MSSSRLTPSSVLASLGVAGVLVLTLAVSNPRDMPPGRAAARDSNPAENMPDRFAWQIFVDISKPPAIGSKLALWETWINEDDVFANPNVAAMWPGVPTPLIAQVPVKRLTPIRQLEIARDEERARRVRLRARGAPVKGIMPQFVPPQEGSGEEVRMNKATFDFVVANNLWFIEGQEAAFAKGSAIIFPEDSKEIKAIWAPISVADEPKYHWAPNPADGNKPYGLVALHIISKDLPNWTWATFEHVDNPQRCKVLGCNDTFGVDNAGNPSKELVAMMKAGGLADEWQNYRLGGSQVDFTDATGRPTLLGNSITEDGFVATSSCITCHARSAIGPRSPGQTKANRLSVFKTTSPLVSNNGTPDPTWYFTDPSRPTTRKYLQLDFLWSLRNAKRRNP